MQKRLLFFSVILLICSCTKQVSTIENYRKDFTSEEQKIISFSESLIKEAYYTTLITINEKGEPKARIMEPFAPEEEFVIWLATNPKSRKATELKANSTATLHYYNKNKMEYVSLMGNAVLVNDEAIKAQKFKKGWERFYKNQKEAYLLIKFVPKMLELISLSTEFTGDEITWKPHQVILRK